MCFYMSEVIKSFNPFPNKSWFLHFCSTSFLKTVRKGEIARNEQFLLFPLCFLPVCHFIKSKIVIYANSVRLEESKICHLGKN